MDDVAALFGDDFDSNTGATPSVAASTTAAAAAAVDDLFAEEEDDDAVPVSSLHAKTSVAASSEGVGAPAARAESPGGSSSSSSSSSDSSDDSSSSDSSDSSDSDSERKPKARSEAADNDSAPAKKRLRKLQPKRQRRVAAKRFKEADAIKSSGEKKKDEDGDEYDSGPEAHRTAEDDAFIDREGDDNELLAEYDAEDQNFGDTAPSRKPGAKKKRRGDRDHSDDENAGGKAKPKSSAASASSAAKKRRAGLTDAQKQAMVDGLIRDMRAAAATDRADRKAGKPAVAKLKLMNTVRLTVANTSLQEMLLEGTAIGASADYSAANNPTILSVFREWLRPLPGSDLPPLDLRAGIYDLIARLPVAQHHLRDSRIGEVLFALSQHPGETPANRMMLSRLIERYARMIFAKDDSYRGGLDAMLDAQAQQQMGARAGGREAPQPSSSSSSASASALGLGNSLLIPSGADLDMLVAEDVEASLRAEHGGGGSSSGSPAGSSSSSSSSSLQSSAAAAASARAPQPPPAYEGRHARIPAPVVFDFVRRAVRADVDVAASADAPAVSSGGRGGGGSRGGGSGKGSSKEPASASAALKKRITDARRASRKEGLAPAVRMSVEGRGT